MNPLWKRPDSVDGSLMPIHPDRHLMKRESDQSTACRVTAGTMFYRSHHGSGLIGLIHRVGGVAVGVGVAAVDGIPAQEAAGGGGVEADSHQGQAGGAGVGGALLTAEPVVARTGSDGPGGVMHDAVLVGVVAKPIR